MPEQAANPGNRCRRTEPPISIRRFARISCLAAAAATLAISSAMADEPVKGRMISIRGTIDSTLVYRVEAAVRSAIAEKAETLIFDIQASQSDFGSCYNLASSIAEIGGGVRRTVAFIPKPLAGNAVLVALACNDIVMAPGATIGDVTAGGDLKPRERAIFESIAVEKGHGKAIAIGLADKNAKLYEVLTANGKAIKTADELTELEKSGRILKKDAIKEPGQNWVLSADLARRLGLASLIRESRKDVAVYYQLPEQAAAEDATFKEAVSPCLLRIVGPINQRLYQSIQRRLRDAQNRGSTLLFVELESSGGDVEAASSLMNLLDRWPGQKVAWVPNKATGPAVLVLLGCDELVVGPQAVVGDMEVGESPEIAPRLADAAVQAAKDGKFSEAVVRGMIDRNETVWEVRNKNNPGLRSFRTAKELEDADVAKDWEKQRIVKDAGAVFRVQGGEVARSLDLAVAVVDSQEKLLNSYSVQGKVPVLQPNWVDALVDALTSPGATVFLLVVGMTCLYIEFQMPGFGVAGLTSAVCFVLFFWARFLSETANSLEIVMFVLGLVFLAIELFVLPGFGITGIAGIVLMLASLVLASQSFSMPTSESQTRELMGNVAQIVGSMVLFFVVAGALARFFPHLPILNRMVLAPPAMDDFDAADSEVDASLAEHALMGRVGVAASPLRPAGRMKLGDEYLDVLTQGEFIEPGAEVEIVQVYPNRIFVRSRVRG